VSPEQFACVLAAFEKHAHLQFSWDASEGAATFNVSLSNNPWNSVMGRTRDEAILQVVAKVKALAQELEEIGV
jgi:hypothetical protein